MTPQTEFLLRIALGSGSIFLFIAGLYLLLKTTNGPFGFRPRDQFNAALDDLRERLALVENNLEALDPEKAWQAEDEKFFKENKKEILEALDAKNWKETRGTGSLAQGLNISGIRLDELQRVLKILATFEVEMGDSRLYKRIVSKLTADN